MVSVRMDRHPRIDPDCQHPFYLEGRKATVRTLFFFWHEARIDLAPAGHALRRILHTWNPSFRLYFSILHLFPSGYLDAFLWLGDALDLEFRTSIHYPAWVGVSNSGVWRFFVYSVLLQFQCGKFLLSDKQFPHGCDLRPLPSHLRSLHMATQIYQHHSRRPAMNQCSISINSTGLSMRKDASAS